VLAFLAFQDVCVVVSILWLLHSSGGITSHTLRDSTSSVTETSAANHVSNRLTAVVLSKRTIQCLFYMAVGVMRLYPALNAAGLDFGTALILVVTQFPVTVFVLGTLAVLPSTFIGCKIKESMGLSLDRFVGMRRMCDPSDRDVFWCGGTALCSSTSVMF
jgi:hypothetical protein